MCNTCSILKTQMYSAAKGSEECISAEDELISHLNYARVARMNYNQAKNSFKEDILLPSYLRLAC